jgi:phage tail-like protein
MAVEKTRNTENFYQTVNFHFRVEFRSEAQSLDISFQSVTGLDSTLDTETVKEGGENRFEHVVPVRRKYGPLILKRGLLTPAESGITKWLKKVFDDQIVKPIETVHIKLLNQDHQPLMQWTINNVWPRSWKIGELNAERGEVLIETMELNYNYLKLDE